MGRRKIKKSRQAAERVLSILDRLSGRQDDSRDRRRGGRRYRPDNGRGRTDRARDGRGGGREGRGGRGRPDRPSRDVRYLPIRGNEELFAKLCHDDFEYLMSRPFSAPADVLEVLLPQSVAGRAQNGHGWFADSYGSPLVFREATFDRILTELEKTWPGLRHDAVRLRRQRLVDNVREHVLARIGTSTMTLETVDGPLLGADFLRGVEVDTADFLRGMVLAGYMDDWDQRRMTTVWNGRAFDGGRYELGGGDIRVVDREMFRMTGIGDAGIGAWEDDELRELERLGVLMPLGDDREWEYPRYDQVYFRRRTGDGVCDDLALIRIGAEWGFAGLLGAFAMDAIDAYDKHLARFASKGTDHALAEAIQQAWLEKTGENLVGGEQILDLIRFAAKDNDPPTRLSSSHRRFLQTEPKGRVPTLLHHWRFLQGEKLDEIKLGFARVPAREFYALAHARLRSIGSPVGSPEFRSESGKDSG